MANDKRRTNDEMEMLSQEKPQGYLLMLPMTLGDGALWGLKEIAHYLGYRSPKSVMRAYENGEIFMLRRRRPHPPRDMWWSHPYLLTLWMLSRFGVELKEYRAQKREMRRLSAEAAEKSRDT